MKGSVTDESLVHFPSLRTRPTFSPSQQQRNFGNGGRAPASEWPQFQGTRGTGGDTTDSPSSTSIPSGTSPSGTNERVRSVTLDRSPVGTGAAQIGGGVGGERGSPLGNKSGQQLPPPRSSLTTGGVPSGRSSPTVEKKGLDNGLGKVNGFGGVDAITDQFSNVRRLSSSSPFRATR